MALLHVCTEILRYKRINFNLYSLKVYSLSQIALLSDLFITNQFQTHPNARSVQIAQE
ncbi:hypothetical protein D791_02432 [Nitrincola nitratireducens]|uniref:Uncharacterized protein n=1 Tax=Nitrincola nitratireducens TaxID=1229521 RepID=W9V0W7_9GAMM|nr:hypothetical protein D791_02432 [Nitrincola nitratireducens]